MSGEASVFKEIAGALGAFYQSEYCHNDGPEGPNDADEDAAATILYAAECYMHQMKEFAVLCSRRGLDAADYWAQFAQEEGEDLDPESAMLAEVRHQLDDLDVIAGYAASLKTASLVRVSE